MNFPNQRQKNVSRFSLGTHSKLINVNISLTFDFLLKFSSLKDVNFGENSSLNSPADSPKNIHTNHFHMFSRHEFIQEENSFENIGNRNEVFLANVKRKFASPFQESREIVTFTGDSDGILLVMRDSFSLLAVFSQ